MNKNILLDIEKILEADRQLRIEEARSNIFDFAEFVMVDENNAKWKLGRHQKEWYTLLNNNNLKKVVILCSRIHAKTDTLISWILYTIGKNPNITFKYVSCNDDLAIDIVSKISNNIINNEDYKAVFPHVIPSKEGEWSKHSLFIKRTAAIGLKDATIEAKGVISSGTGGRCHVLVLDDVIDFRVAYSQPKMLDTIRYAIESDWFNLLYPGGRIILVGTPWSFDPPDVNVAYSSNAAIKLSPGQNLEYLASLASDDWVCWRGPAIIDGKPLWPEKWTLEALEQRRRTIANELAWQQQYMLEGMRGKANWFDESWIQQCIDRDRSIGESIDPDWPIYVGVDPARSFNRDASNSAIIVVALDNEGKRIPVEIFADKIDPPQLADHLIRIYLKYNPICIMVENNSYQSALIDIVNIKAQSIANGLVLPIKGQFTGSQKWSPEKGLPKIAAQLAAGKWIFPLEGDEHFDINHTCEMCKLLNEMRWFGKKQMTTDLIMAMWLADCAIESTNIFGNIETISLVRKREI